MSSESVDPASSEFTTSADVEQRIDVSSGSAEPVRTDDIDVEALALPREDIGDPRVLDILDEVDGGRVLDLGCVQHDPAKRRDPDWLHQHLYRTADEILGVDVDEKGVRELQAAGFNVTVGDAEVLDGHGQYDYIVAGDLIEHLENPGRFLSAARSRLADDGKLVVTTPNPWCWPRLKRLAFGGEVHCNPEHTHYHDRRTLRQLLERKEFEFRIDFVGPMSEGISRRLFRTPISQLKRLGATSLLAIAEPR